MQADTGLGLWLGPGRAAEGWPRPRLQTCWVGAAGGYSYHQPLRIGAATHNHARTSHNGTYTRWPES